jgi:hypothetical protein
MTDITPLAIVSNDHDEAILVPGDIEHRKLANLICTAKHPPHIRKILPARVFNSFNPMP